MSEDYDIDDNKKILKEKTLKEKTLNINEFLETLSRILSAKYQAKIKITIKEDKPWKPYIAERNYLKDGEYP